jgi:hypothetical protein
LTIERDEDKTRVGRPFAYWDLNDDYLSAVLATFALAGARARHPALAQWAKTTRLNPTSGLTAHRDDPRVADARERVKRSAMAAGANLARLLARRPEPTPTR